MQRRPVPAPRLPFDPEVPVRAFEEFLPGALAQDADHRVWEPSDGRLPVMYLSHGAPPVLDDPDWLSAFFGWARSLPKPRGIVVVSAHWEAAPVALSATQAGVPLYYDFGGFHPRYYQVTYPTPDAGALARDVVGALASHGPASLGPIHQFPDRGLDHGAFIPLMAMYPRADVPVLQVSLPSLDPADALRLGQRLASLRDQGYLVVGSGQLTHWFGAIQRPPETYGTLAAPMADFEAWAVESLHRGDVDALVDFRHAAPGNAQAHRTADHYVPLLTAVGAADRPSEARTAIEKVWISNSCLSFQFD